MRTAPLLCAHLTATADAQVVFLHLHVNQNGTMGTALPSPCGTTNEVTFQMYHF